MALSQKSTGETLPFYHDSCLFIYFMTLSIVEVMECELKRKHL